MCIRDSDCNMSLIINYSKTDSNILILVEKHPLSSFVKHSNYYKLQYSVNINIVSRHLQHNTIASKAVCLSAVTVSEEEVHVPTAQHLIVNFIVCEGVISAEIVDCVRKLALISIQIAYIFLRRSERSF